MAELAEIDHEQITEDTDESKILKSHYYYPKVRLWYCVQPKSCMILKSQYLAMFDIPYNFKGNI